MDSRQHKTSHHLLKNPCCKNNSSGKTRKCFRQKMTTERNLILEKLNLLWITTSDRKSFIPSQVLWLYKLHSYGSHHYFVDMDLFLIQDNRSVVKIHVCAYHEFFSSSRLAQLIELVNVLLVSTMTSVSATWCSIWILHDNGESYSGFIWQLPNSTLRRH